MITNSNSLEMNFKKKVRFESGISNIEIILTLKNGSCFGLSGDSGSGKTTILNMLSGFVNPDEGYIIYNENYWYSSIDKKRVKTEKRGIGFAFQKPALFPHMTLLENLKFTGADSNTIESYLRLFKIEELHSHKPAKLSGGQQQKAQYIMVMIQKPKLLLLDEPFSAIDEKTRILFTKHLNEYIRTTSTPTIIVSHNNKTLNDLCSKILTLKNGKIIKENNLNKKEKVLYFYN